MSFVQKVPGQQRVHRKPTHKFQLKTRPWQIAPFLLAPVLPGETLKNLLVQSRVVSQPVKNPLIGWHKEYYFFYVKHRDTLYKNLAVQMALDPLSATVFTQANVDAAFRTYADGRTEGFGAVYAAADPIANKRANSVPWARACLARVVNTYFRDQTENWDTWLLDNLPLAQIGYENQLNSLMSNTEYAASEIKQIPADIDGDGTIEADEISVATAKWQYLIENGLTTATYEQYLQAFGVRVPDSPQTEDPAIPELIRFVRDWSYPANTIDPTTGTPSSALSWSIAERADKDRFFKEPGFIFGVTVTRPKVYLSNLIGNGVENLDKGQFWLPAIFDGSQPLGMHSFATATGPVPSSTGTYWLDVRDLFVHGDEFKNYALAAADNIVALPTTALEKKYPSATDADGLFKGTTAGTKEIREDGVVSLDILGRVRDQSYRT